MRQNIIFIILGLTFGYIICHSYDRLIVIGSYNQMMADQYSDYLLPLIPLIENESKTEDLLNKYKKTYPQLIWLEQPTLKNNFIFAWIYSDKSPSHVGVLKYNESGKIVAAILENDEFIKMLYKQR